MQRRLIIIIRIFIIIIIIIVIIIIIIIIILIIIIIIIIIIYYCYYYLSDIIHLPAFDHPMHYSKSKQQDQLIFHFVFLMSNAYFKITAFSNKKKYSVDRIVTRESIVNSL